MVKACFFIALFSLSVSKDEIFYLFYYYAIYQDRKEKITQQNLCPCDCRNIIFTFVSRGINRRGLALKKGLGNFRGSPLPTDIN